MDIDPTKMVMLRALEDEVFGAMLEACRQNEDEVAERLFKVWIKLPTHRPWPVGPKESLLPRNTNI